MPDSLNRCSVCHALLDEEDLFCANCGTEAPHEEDRATTADAMVLTHNFVCQGCGAAMSYDASAQSLRCPFCGSQRMEKNADGRSLAPRRVVPFEVGRERAQGILRQWMGKGFWRPGDLSARARITKITPVYVPYWVFSASTHTYWTADSNQTPAGARGDWVPLAGEHRSRYDGILVGASGALTASETNAICPFELAAAVPPEQVDLVNVVVEQFRVQRKYARPLARQGLEAFERRACAAYVPGRARNVHVNVRLQGLSSEPVLLPIWIMAYRYDDKVFRFVLNGQTGQATGQAPFSWRKLGGVVGIAVAVILAVVGLFLLIGLFVSLMNG